MSCGRLTATASETACAPTVSPDFRYRIKGREPFGQLASYEVVERNEVGVIADLFASARGR